MNIEKIVPEELVTHFKNALDIYNISTVLEVSHFLSQVAHESMNFKVTEENLNYSAERLVEVFPKYFPNIENADSYNRNPKKIANKIYSNRLGNGNEESGEGWRYRGRGYIQLTGKFNYAKFCTKMGVDCVGNPALLSQPKYASLSAAWFWHINNLNEIADEGSTINVIKKITKIVNGGYNGLADRVIKFHKIYYILNNDDIANIQNSIPKAKGLEFPNNSEKHKNEN